MVQNPEAKGAYRSVGELGGSKAVKNRKRGESGGV